MPPLAALTRLAHNTSASHSQQGYTPLPSWLSSVPSSPILSRTTKDGRPRWRKTWLGALPAVLLVLWLLSRDSAESTEGPKELLHEVIDACKTKEVLQGRTQASFWVAEIGATHLTIRPRSTSLASLNCPTLSSAYFTPRLHFSSLERRLLLPSIPAQPSPGIYSFPLLAPITAQLFPEVKIEVVLDSGWFPGGAEGMPCGEEKRVCDYEEMIGRGYKWTEVEVLDTKGERPSYRNRFRPLLTLPRYTSPSSPSPDLPLCPSLSYIPGSWLPNSHTYSFLSSQDSSPCRLLSPSAYANASSLPSFNAEPPRPKRWLRLLGDSNLRTLLHPLASSLGIDPSTHCLAHQGTNDAHPTTLLCWSDELLLSFNWWFGNQGSKNTAHEGDAKKLEHLLAWSAGDLLASVPWEKTAAWPRHFEDFAEPAEAIFLSIGSHMPAETSLGMSALLTALEPVLFPPSSPPLPLILALTSATAPSRLPPLYESSRVMRNDLMIRATNAVIQRWAEERETPVKTMDLYTMSRTAGTEMMKDPVHFWDPMYITWTSLFFYAWQTLLPTSPFLPPPSSSPPTNAGKGWEIVRLPPSAPAPPTPEGFGITDPLLMGETVVDEQRLAEKLEEEQGDGGIEREKVDVGVRED